MCKNARNLSRELKFLGATSYQRWQSTAPPQDNGLKTSLQGSGTEAQHETLRCGDFMRTGVKIMSRGMRSMTALPGLLAVAGYQNRDMLAEFCKRQELSA